MIGLQVLRAILKGRAYPWVPRGQDRRQINKLVAEYRRLSQRRKAK